MSVNYTVFDAIRELGNGLQGTVDERRTAILRLVEDKRSTGSAAPSVLVERLANADYLDETRSIPITASVDSSSIAQLVVAIVRGIRSTESSSHVTYGTEKFKMTVGRNGELESTTLVPTVLLVTSWPRDNLELFLRELGITTRLEIETAVNLAWLILTDSEPFPSKEAITAKMSKSEEEITTILTNAGYTGGNSRAERLYTYLTYHTITNYQVVATRDPDYGNLTNKPPFGVVMAMCIIFRWNRANNVPISMDRDVYQTVASFLGNRAVSDNFKAVVNVCLTLSSIEQVPVLMRRLGIVPDISTRNNSLHWFISNVASYSPVISRGPNVGQPLQAEFLAGGAQLRDYFEMYSDVELLSNYPKYDITTPARPRRVEVLATATATPENETERWSFQYRNCTNLNEGPDALAETRPADALRDLDTTDIIISYGSSSGRRCYTADILEYNISPGGFKVPAPSVTTPGEDPVYDTFDEEQTRELKVLLEAIPENRRPANVVSLLRAINALLANVDEAKSFVATLKAARRGLSPTWQTAYDNFFWWLMIYAMWLRQWNGPGYIPPAGSDPRSTYPYRELGEHAEDPSICVMAVRDLNVQREGRVIRSLVVPEETIYSSNDEIRNESRNYLTRVLDLPLNIDYESPEARENIRKIGEAIKTIPFIRHENFSNAVLSSGANSNMWEWTRESLKSHARQSDGRCLRETAKLTSPTASYLIYGLFWPAGSEATPREIYTGLGNRIVQRIKRIYTDFPDAINPLYPNAANAPPFDMESFLVSFRGDMTFLHPEFDRNARVRRADPLPYVNDYIRTLSPAAKYWVVVPWYADRV